MKVLTLVSVWKKKSVSNASRDGSLTSESPRDSLYETTLNSDMFDGRFLEKVPPFRRNLYRLLPLTVAQVVETYIVKRRYDAIITWTDAGALLFALFLKLTRVRVPHVAMMFWISKPKKAFVLKHVHSHISRIILWTSAHRDFAIEKLGVPREKIVYIPHYVDQQFWKPMPGAEDMICSGGREMRDYPTLIEAMRGLDIACHIATGNFRGKMEATVKPLYEEIELPPNITVGKKDYLELRALYARSRFVVVPLLPSDSDNGLNVILEGMAMGKAVICSRIRGQKDVIQEGKTGLYVPPQDISALRTAIRFLWDNPDIAKRIGTAAREHIVAFHSLDNFVSKVKEVVEGVISGNPQSGSR